MKKSALSLALAASALLPAVASAEVVGIKLKDGYTVSYTFSYESDSGYADINVCEVVVKNDSAVQVASKKIDLNDVRFNCGGVARNQTATYRAFVESDSGHTDRGCFDVATGLSVNASFCGFKN
jgi:hypothetical protein